MFALSLSRGVLAATVLSSLVGPAVALDHGESPLVSRQPKTDGTDLFVFRSYEAGREDFVTLIACFQPFQDAFAGPDYFLMDPDARYEIHVDTDDDGAADLSFRFQFKNAMRRTATAVGQTPPAKLPVVNMQPISSIVDPPEVAVREIYTVDLVDHASGTFARLNDVNGNSVFVKPTDAIGSRSFVDYPSYAAAHVYDLAAPAKHGRVFVGQRKDPRGIAMGGLFDLVGLDLTGPTFGGTDNLAAKNVTALAIEVPVSLLGAAKKVVGVWATASLPANRTLLADASFDSIGPQVGNFVQVSRTGAPLVSSLFIGVDDKDRFNTSEPLADPQFATYFTQPSFADLIEQETGLVAPVGPRTDLRDYYLSGFPGLTEGAPTGERLRFRYANEPVPAASQSNLGVLGGDDAGYPNGRRPGDDVVDITLRALMGAHLPPAQAPSGGLPLTDGVHVDATMFSSVFPYLGTPILGN